jgi:16S rRNA (guanine527-N7)-methyltransferase
LSAWPPDELVQALVTARSHGFLGPGPVVEHIAHAVGLGRAVGQPPRRALDLGSGAGVPGIVLALVWPDSTWVLVDSGQRRAALLETAVGALGLQARASVVWGRAEDVGREVAHRGAFDLVTARSFAAPAVTAECAAPFLAVGGTLAVTEPPEDAERWPTPGLALLGLEVLERVAGPPRVQLLRQITLCPDTYPRRVGIPAKRPLF